MALRSSHMDIINMFHKKTLRAILSLSQRAPIPALYFLLGELPLEAKIHRDVFSIFYSILSNPGTKIYRIVEYLLQEAPENSRTWSIYLRNLSVKYGLPDPLEFMTSLSMKKTSFLNLDKTKITVYHETELRELASDNSKMNYLNVATKGLNGRHHPVLSSATTSKEVKELRPVLKMLTMDYYTYSMRASQSGGSSHCRICSALNSGEDKS